jgi:hypothetical protein
MTTKPGKCNLFKYKFLVEADQPIVGYSRPIPFATRPEVQRQIEQMIGDDILEVINPALFELQDEEGKYRGLFNLRHLKPYLKADEDV